MKFTILVTQDCNLACTYCYVNKHPSVMEIGVAEKVVEFIFERADANEQNGIAFFGGEPMLELSLMKKIVDIIEKHPRFHEFMIDFSVVTNGTIFTDEIAAFLIKHDITYCLSCDGDVDVQDLHRRFRNGEGSSNVVEATIRRAAADLPIVLVNAVYSPATLKSLPNTVRYLMGLGLRQIHVNPDYSASWRSENVETLKSVYGELADIYMDSYKSGNPVYINAIDGKIAILLRGGYQHAERCHMGKKEFAFSPEGNVFPCERIIEDGRSDNKHCLGNVDKGIDLSLLTCNMMGTDDVNAECLTCGISKYCMNWCGCSNYLSTGYYNRAGAFLCAEQRMLVTTAFHILETLSKEMPEVFAEHISGHPMLNSMK